MSIANPVVDEQQLEIFRLRRINDKLKTHLRDSCCGDSTRRTVDHCIRNDMCQCELKTLLEE